MAWQEIITDAGVWVHEYEANGYKANAFAVMLDEKGLAVVSPPTGMLEADFAALEAQGRITAIIAPHSGHDLGLAEWRSRYPNAQLYAPTAALSTLNALKIGLFASLSQLPTTSKLEFWEVPATKKGGTIVIFRQGERPIIYLDELVINWTSLPKPLLAKFLFWLHKSAPGLKINRVYARVLCTDVQLVAKTVLKALADDPVMVFAHGTPLIHKGDAARVQDLVRSLLSVS